MFKRKPVLAGLAFFVLIVLWASILHITYCRNYTCVLNYLLQLKQEYAKYELYEHTDYRTEVSYSIEMNDYKIRLVIYEAR